MKKLLRLTNGFTQMADANLKTRVYQSITWMPGNDNFPTPAPSVAEVSTGIAEYVDALSATA